MSRTAVEKQVSQSNSAASATFVKRGMPLAIFPPPGHNGWQHTDGLVKSIDITQPPVDLPSLVHLVEDSFNRPLDVKHYLQRIKGHLAGVVVAGKYEGGAILTWESDDRLDAADGSGTPGASRAVPYLDKFAVRKRSQGSGGVADIVFTAMARICFPGGFVWRSRSNNPVNRWYFERAIGTWKLPGSQWTIFWTTDEVALDPSKWASYVAVCRKVEPSWADTENIAD